MARHEHATVASQGGGLPTPDTVVVHGDGVRVDRVHTELPRAEARSRFGGVDPLAVLAGTTAAIGTLAVLSSLAGALGRVGYTQGVGEQELSTAALAAGLVILGLSLLWGGWVTGRVARYEGKRNGFLTGLLFVLLSAALAAAASASDDVRNLELPSWLDTDTLTVAAIASAVTGLIVALGAATLGGRIGAGWHRKVDDALLGTRAGGVAPYPTSGPLGGATATPAGTSPRSADAAR
ncbi:MAG: conserved rane protein of unknown function [Frankiales bacterium]|nr:conserved rane protein of unknown function [Frankiales bacterium]